MSYCVNRDDTQYIKPVRFAPPRQVVPTHVPAPTRPRRVDWIIIKPSGFARIGQIQAAVAECFAIPMRHLIGRRNDAEAVRARQAAMYLCRKLTRRSMVAIADRFDGRDHTTVIAALQAVEKRRRQDSEYDRVLGELEGRL